MKTREELVAIALAHARSESGDGVDLTLSTLEPDPVYELQPVGRVMRGLSAARRYDELLRLLFGPAYEFSEPLG
jgi:hypothetical protein